MYGFVLLHGKRTSTGDLYMAVANKTDVWLLNKHQNRRSLLIGTSIERLQLLLLYDFPEALWPSKQNFGTSTPGVQPSFQSATALGPSLWNPESWFDFLIAVSDCPWSSPKLLESWLFSPRTGRSQKPHCGGGGSLHTILANYKRALHHWNKACVSPNV